VLVRPAEPADAAAVAAVYAPYVTDGVASFESEPPTAADLRRRMLGERRLPWFVACEGDDVAGYAYAAPHRARAAYRWSVETSVYVDERWHRRGVARLLYDRLLDELPGLGYVTAYAGITLPNDASVRLHEAMGFRPVGTFRRVGYKHGRWHDVGWWQRPLREPPSDPAEPVPWEPR
jgi:phosphinothricin acetyltransferase